MTGLFRRGALLLGVAGALFAGMQDGADSKLRELREQSMRNPERLDLRLALGNAAVQSQSYDVALEAFQDVLAVLDPDSAAAGDVELRIGETYRLKGDLESAASALRKARELLPDNSVVPGALALVLDLSGKFGEAEQSYRDALKLDPESATTMNNLAYLLAMHGGSIEEARVLAARAHAADPDSGDFSDTLAVVLSRAGDLAGARAILLGLVCREPADEGFRRHLATVLEQEPARGTREDQLLSALRDSGSSPDLVLALASKIR